ncbi:MAG: hypothetical protein AABZ44_03445 [Elusimicrobiota bacterium]
MNLAHLMKARYVGIKDLKAHLSSLLEINKPLVVTDRGQPKHFVIPYEEMLEIVDILEEAAQPKVVAQVARARAAYRKSGGVPVDMKRLRGKLGLA